MGREFTEKLIALLECGELDATDVADRLTGYMTEEDVEDFCLTEFPEYFEEEEFEDEDETDKAENKDVECDD